MHVFRILHKHFCKESKTQKREFFEEIVKVLHQVFLQEVWGLTCAHPKNIITNEELVRIHEVSTAHKRMS